MSIRNFKLEKLDTENFQTLTKRAKKMRANIIKMTTVAKSGHPGGSMSSIDMYNLIYSCFNITKDNFNDLDRDRVVISHGHTSPAAYSTLLEFGFMKDDSCLSTFRKVGSIYEGHIERIIPGIEWTGGNLGQGLSAACGFALSAKLRKKDYKVLCVMGDGEQQKGQISEARRFASKYNLNNLIVMVDLNRLQISGDINEVMPQDIEGEFRVAGFNVYKVDGHDYNELYKVLRSANKSDKPVCIIADTIMGKGVDFMEDQHKYHGAPLTLEQAADAFKQLNQTNDLDELFKKRGEFNRFDTAEVQTNHFPEVNLMERRVYEDKIDLRSAFGNAAYDVVKANNGKTDVAVFDCDLAASVKTGQVKAEYPESFIQCGISEHHTAIVCGATSVSNVLSIWAEFGVFGVCETYNQNRMNDINHTNMKLFTTHVGLDVGEDGRTHQCIDYMGVMKNLYHFKILVPADGNHTDVLCRYSFTEKGNTYVAMGRSKLGIIRKEDGTVFYDKDYKLDFGKADKIRSGKQVAVCAIGTLGMEAYNAVEELRKQNIDAALYIFHTVNEFKNSDLAELAEIEKVIVVEDHNANTGLGAELKLALFNAGKLAEVHALGAEDYSYSGSAADLFNYYKLDKAGIIEKAKEII